jgi:glycosyltransferase involved in cell wall biosynthesis
LKVAYFSPLPPERSGVATYSAFLLPALQRRLAVEVVRRGSKRFPVGADIALYHIGNEPNAHGWILKALRSRPGVVVLHEAVLHELVATLTLGRGGKTAYLDAVERDGGRVARLLATDALAGRLPPLWELWPSVFPLLDEVFEHAEGVVVHSRYAEALLRRRGYEGPLHRVPLAADLAPHARDQSPDVHGSPLICSLGVLNVAKRVPQLLEAFARLRQSHPRAVLVLAGSGGADLRLGLRAERAGLRLGSDVVYLGFVSGSRLSALLAAADVCVNLRWPTLGEGSGSALQALAAGRPLVVSDVGWFSELPGSVAAKVPVDEHEVEMLVAVLDLLARKPRLRDRMGRAARDYVKAEHDVDRAAEGYEKALAAVLAARDTGKPHDYVLPPPRTPRP